LKTAIKKTSVSKSILIDNDASFWIFALST
jgi:hypothetical protein